MWWSSGQHSLLSIEWPWVKYLRRFLRERGFLKFALCQCNQKNKCRIKNNLNYVASKDQLVAIFVGQMIKTLNERIKGRIIKLNGNVYWASVKTTELGIPIAGTDTYRR